MKLHALRVATLVSIGPLKRTPGRWYAAAEDMHGSVKLVRASGMQMQDAMHPCSAVKNQSRMAGGGNENRSVGDWE